MFQSGAMPTRTEWIVAIVSGLAVCALPVVRTLGYESAVTIAVVSGVIALRRGLREGRALRASVGDSRRPLRRVADASGDPFREAAGGFVRAAVAGLLTVIPPFLLLAASTRFVQGCRTGPGTLLVLFIAVPAVAHLAATGLLVGAVFLRRRARCLALGGILALHAAHAAWQALTGLTVPHSLPLGLLSASAWGGIGTVTLDLPASYYLLRGLAVAICPLMVGLAGLACLRAAQDGPRSIEPHVPGVALALSALPLAVALLFYPSAFGLTSGVGTRERALSGWTRTEHVLVRFTPGGAVEADVGTIASAAEWDFGIVSAVLDLKDPRPVTIWIYDDDDSIRRLTGAEGFLFALPWRRELHTVLAPGGGEAMRHELVHLLAADWGRPPLGISWNQALLEGTAEAVASWSFAGGEFQSEGAAAMRAGRLTRATDLFAPAGFAWGGGAVGISYRFAASFVGFLLESYGPGPLSLAYGGASWVEAYGKDLDTLDGEWRAFLEGVPVSDDEIERAAAAYDPERHPAFHRIRCPRVGLASVPEREAQPRAGDTAGSTTTGETSRSGVGEDAGDAGTGTDVLTGERHRARETARGLAEAALASGRVEDAAAAVRRLDAAGLDEEAAALLTTLLEKKAGDALVTERLRRLLALQFVASGRAGEAVAMLDPRVGQVARGTAKGGEGRYGAREREAAGSDETPTGCDGLDLFRLIASSPSGPALARLLLSGVSPSTQSASVRDALGIDPSGPAAWIAAEYLCSWPPAGESDTAVRLLKGFTAGVLAVDDRVMNAPANGMESKPLCGPLESATVRLAGLALARGRAEDAARLYGSLVGRSRDTRTRLLAAEGLARATRLPADVFVRREIAAIQSAPSRNPGDRP